MYSLNIFILQFTCFCNCELCSLATIRYKHYIASLIISAAILKLGCLNKQSGNCVNFMIFETKYISTSLYIYCHYTYFQQRVINNWRSLSLEYYKCYRSNECEKVKIKGHSNHTGFSESPTKMCGNVYWT